MAKPKLIDIKAETAHAHDRVAQYKFIFKEIVRAKVEMYKHCGNDKFWFNEEVVVKLLCAKNGWDIEEVRETIMFYNEWIEDTCLG